MIDILNSKYFKLSVGKIKKETPDEISCCCPACDDTKNRLHLYHTEVGDLVHCFNAGCELSEKHKVTIEKALLMRLDIMDRRSCTAGKSHTLSFFKITELKKIYSALRAINPKSEIANKYFEEKK